MIEILDKRVIEFTIPLDEYSKIHHDSCLLDALIQLETSRQNLYNKRHCKHPLLVVDDNNRVIGKIGPICCLRAINPSFNIDFDDIEIIKSVEEFHSEFLEYIICKQIFEICIQTEKKDLAKEIKIINIMYPILDSVDGEYSIIFAINKIIGLNTLSLPVTMKSEVVGLIHLFDLYNEISRFSEPMKVISH